LSSFQSKEWLAVSSWLLWTDQGGEEACWAGLGWSCLWVQPGPETKVVPLACEEQMSPFILKHNKWLF
jgi:hypothetical protein